MKTSFLALSAALLLAGCNHTAPETENPAGPAAAVPLSTARADSAMSAATAPPPDASATTTAPASAPPKPVLENTAGLRASFHFKPAADASPGQTQTSALLFLQGSPSMYIELGKFDGKPDVVDAAKAKAANFPAGMLMGFRSYQAATGTSQDLAVLAVDGTHLRIVRRNVAEAAEPGKFETFREIPVPANTVVVVAPPN